MSRVSKGALAAGLAVVAAGWGTLAWRRGATPDPGPFTYRAARMAAPITVDGRTDEDGWAALSPTRHFVRSDGRSRAPRDCSARIGWDAEALYFAFDIEDDDPHNPHTRRDEDLWTHDVVEVFLDPGADGLHYYELQVTPDGVVFDALFPRYRQDLARARTWNAPGLEAGARRRPGGWTAELRLPFAGLRHTPSRHPAPGDTWRMNLYRIDAHPDGRPSDFTAWTPPLVGDFHALERFGSLVFAQ